MKRIRVTALCVAIGIGGAACSDKNPSAPVETDLNPPAGMVISNAQVSSGAGNSIGGVISLAVSASSVAYISAVPGTFPGGVSVTVRNETLSGPSLSVQVIDGGFDPVGVEARVGDELSLKVSISGGEPRLRRIKVPARRPPAVVRTNPAKGRTDVALNVQVLVVFSEPVDKSTVTSSSVALLKDGVAVPGRLEVAVDGLSVEFIPDSPLQAQATYSLTVDRGIRDVDGEALGDASVATFATTSATAVFGSIFGLVLDGPTRAPLSGHTSTPSVLAGPVSNPNQNQPFFQTYDPRYGSFYSRPLPPGKWSLTFSVWHPWRWVFPNLPLYADTTVIVDVVAGKTTVMPDLLLRPRPPLLLIAVETCPWPLPDPPTEADWGECDSGYWGGADVQIEVNGVAGTRTAGFHHEAAIGPAQGKPPAFWYDTSHSTYLDITIPGDYDVSIVRVAPSFYGKTWKLVPWRTSTTRVTVEHGLAYVEFEFSHT